MKKSNKVDKTTDKNHLKSKDFNPDPVEIIWNKDARKPANNSPEDNI
ncbi:hypothetical protein CPJCM30710_10550 [Clostridium polyendosporum]|uniref:Uncharacterized protein n=1 Tax=Clostridium polyendosporum TaxID=69208 RepID=A0A919RY35_9CLOT|nr:hypothetical protein [Clostridium polyendosporum]GIM28389.1 hypothetical protein CPJCM30710_10550 [Clostridium polyendosporum]